MKRSEMLKKITSIVGDPWIFLEPHEYAAKVLDAIEEAGMLPPTNTCKLIPDGKGGEKHSESKRAWDEEI